MTLQVLEYRNLACRSAVGVEEVMFAQACILLHIWMTYTLKVTYRHAVSCLLNPLACYQMILQSCFTCVRFCLIISVISVLAVV